MLVPLSMTVGLGLGAACAPLLSPADIYSVARSAGFPPSTAVQMTAIAMRESAGCASAHNYRPKGQNGPNDPGEDSYGLWQINANAHMDIIARLGGSATALYDPATNAAAAFILWGGNDNNLNSAWYINRPGYAEAYQANLPAAQAAAASVESDAFDGTSAADLGTQSITIAGYDFTPLQLGIGALGLTAFVGLLFAFRN